MSEQETREVGLEALKVVKTINELGPAGSSVNGLAPARYLPSLILRQAKVIGECKNRH